MFKLILEDKWDVMRAPENKAEKDTKAKPKKAQEGKAPPSGDSTSVSARKWMQAHYESDLKPLIEEENARQVYEIVIDRSGKVCGI